MKKILVTRRLLRSNEDRIKELYDLNTKEFNENEAKGISSRLTKI